VEVSVCITFAIKLRIGKKIISRNHLLDGSLVHYQHKSHIQYASSMRSMLKIVQIDHKDIFLRSDSLTIGAGAGLLGCWSLVTQDVAHDCMSFIGKMTSSDDVLDPYKLILVIYLLNVLGLELDNHILPLVTGITDWANQIDDLLCICKYFPARIWRFLLTSLADDPNAVQHLSAAINMQQGILVDSSTPGQIVYDNDFFRTFGHNAYQPFFISLDQTLHATSISGISASIFYIKPHSDSVASAFYWLSGNFALVESAMRLLGHNYIDPESDNILLGLDSYPKDPYVAHTYANLGIYSGFGMAYSYAKLIKHTGSYSVNDGHSTAQAFIAASSVSMGDSYWTDFAEFQSIISDLTRCTNPRVVLVHSRNSLFYGDENLRNSDLENYGPALRFLKGQGFTPLLFSAQIHIPNEINNLLIHYPSSGYKNKRNDYLICRFANLFLGNPSGPMYLGDIYQYRSIGIDWWPYGIWPSSKTIVVPRPIRDCRSGHFVSINDFSRIVPDQADRLNPPPYFQVLKASKEDILEACISHFDSSLLVDLESTTECASGMIPQTIAERYNFA
jgi:putative glycosyltransferase (TIGR04372 family)